MKKHFMKLIEILMAADTDCGDGGRDYEDCVDAHTHRLSEADRAALCKLLVGIEKEAE
jgi:hypothetical protein